ncbi:fumarylacetoacetate hydrolase family protein [Hoeflea olei]|uniref:2-hydroxyhepta-2,4-diene-1,7-dioate isomerase n=1 Tax=Hoeflea olei TaxID=1480615 RepID=A0A1C1YR79_9HYPH|nr:fumarylacetoacetate hydrolase family protein [Hoeflea olei]OCW56013.1 2-hydroxyhepta-2,4-diene-1,7-dioate isomerase [Hoeflea olei]
MKLLRIGASGQERPAALDGEGRLRDLSAHVADISGEALSEEGLQRLAALDLRSLPEIDPGQRIGACVGGVGKFICIGLNYIDHAHETGKQAPPEPIVFMKATSAVCGPNDPIEMPQGSEKLDWEVELGVVIGRRAKYVAEHQALAHVAGYCVVNDVSERGFQSERGGQWTKGKSHDSFGPIGPWLVTRDEIADVQDLDLWLEVDGRRMQSGTTANMIFSVAHLVSYLSRFMTLEPGDIIATGTPAGVGMGRSPQLFLKPGNALSLGIDGLGRQSTSVVAAAQQT